MPFLFGAAKLCRVTRTVFISYARRDAADAAERLRNALLQASIAVWQDVHDIRGGLEWRTQIDRTLRDPSLDVMIIIVTAGWFESENCAEEVRVARLEGKPTIPVFWGDRPDIRSLPPRLARAHIYDLTGSTADAHWQALVRQIHEDRELRKVPRTARPVPEHYVSRSPEENVVTEYLKESHASEAGGWLTIFGGLGLGKSSLAAAICVAPEMLATFEDGTLWVDCETDEPNGVIASRLICEVITGANSTGSDEALFSRLRDITQESSILFILDGLRRQDLLRQFQALLMSSPRCACLVTSDSKDIADAAPRTIRLERLPRTAAIQVLQDRAHPEVIDRRYLDDVGQALGDWPQLLALWRPSTTLRTRLPPAHRDDGFTLIGTSAARRILDAVSARMQSVDPAVLQAATRLRGLSANGQFSQETLQVLLDGDASAAERLIHEFDAVGLIDVVPSAIERYAFAPYVVPWLRRDLSQSAVQQAHRDIVDRLSPKRSNYYWTSLIAHLLAADDHAGALARLTDLNWLLDKARAVGIDALLDDFDRLTDPNLLTRAIRDALQLARFALLEEPGQLINQLRGRIPTDTPGWVDVLSSIRSAEPGLTLLSQSLVPIGQGLANVIVERESKTVAMAASLAGQRIYSVDDKRLLREYDAPSGRVTATRPALEAYSASKLILNEERQLLCLHSPRCLQVWDVHTLDELARVEYRQIEAVSHDFGRMVLRSEEPAEYRLHWVLQDQAPILLEGCAGMVDKMLFSEDDRLILSYSSRAGVRTWNASTGARIAVTPTGYGGSFLGINRQATVAFFSDWRRSVQVMSIESGRLLRRIGDERASARDIALSDDGQRMVIVDDRHQATVWEWSTGRRFAQIDAENRSARVVMGPGPGEATVSVDNTIRRFSLDDGRCLQAFRSGHDSIKDTLLHANAREAVTRSDRIEYWSGAAELESPPFEHMGSRPVLTPDGTRFAAFLSESAVVYDTESRVVTARFNINAGRIHSAAWRSDGERLAIGTLTGQVLIYSVGAGRAEPLPDEDGRGMVVAISYTAAGTRLVVVSTHYVEYFETKTWTRCYITRIGTSIDAALITDKLVLVTVSGRFVGLSTESGQVEFEHDVDRRLDPGSIIFVPSEGVVWCSQDGLRIYDVHTHRSHLIPGPNAYGLVYVPSVNRIAQATKEQVVVWDLRDRTYQTSRERVGASYQRMKASTTAPVFVSFLAGNVQLWSAETASLIASVDTDDAHAFLDVAPSGDVVVAGSSGRIHCFRIDLIESPRSPVPQSRRGKPRRKAFRSTDELFDDGLQIFTVSSRTRSRQTLSRAAPTLSVVQVDKVIDALEDDALAVRLWSDLVKGLSTAEQQDAAGSVERPVEEAVKAPPPWRHAWRVLDLFQARLATLEQAALVIATFGAGPQYISTAVNNDAVTTEQINALATLGLVEVDGDRLRMFEPIAGYICARAGIAQKASAEAARGTSLLRTAMYTPDSRARDELAEPPYLYGRPQSGQPGLRYPVLANPGATILRGHVNAVCDIATCEHDALMVSLSEDGLLHIWDRADLKLVRSARRTGGRASCCAVLRKLGLVLVGGDDGTVGSWSVATGEPRTTFSASTVPIVALRSIGEGERFMSVDRDGNVGIWDGSVGLLKMATAERDTPIKFVSDIVDGRVVFLGHADGAIVGLDLADESWFAELLDHEGAITQVVCDLESDRLYSSAADATIRRWRLSTETCDLVLRGHRDQVNAITVLDEHEVIVSASTDGTLRRWSMRTGEHEVLAGHGGPVSRCIYIEDTQRILSADEAGELRQWTPDGASLGILGRHGGAVTGLYQPPAVGHPISVSSDGMIYVWRDLQRPTFVQGHAAPICVGVASPAAQRLATIDERGEARIWHTTTGALAHSFPAETIGEVRGATFIGDDAASIALMDDYCLYRFRIDGVNMSSATFDGRAGFGPWWVDGRLHVADRFGRVHEVRLVDDESLQIEALDTPKIEGGVSAGCLLNEEPSLITGSPTGQIQRLDDRFRPIWRHEVHNMLVSALASSAGFVASATIDGELALLDARDGSLQWKNCNSTGAILGCWFDSVDRLITAGEDAALSYFDLDSGKVVDRMQGAAGFTAIVAAGPQAIATDRIGNLWWLATGGV